MVAVLVTMKKRGQLNHPDMVQSFGWVYTQFEAQVLRRPSFPACMGAVCRGAAAVSRYFTGRSIRMRCAYSVLGSHPTFCMRLRPVGVFNKADLTAVANRPPIEPIVVQTFYYGWISICRSGLIRMTRARVF